LRNPSGQIEALSGADINVRRIGIGYRKPPVFTITIILLQSVIYHLPLNNGRNNAEFIGFIKPLKKRTNTNLLKKESPNFISTPKNIAPIVGQHLLAPE
jgi:hypothetical protein